MPQLTREEAIEILIKQRALADETQTKDAYIRVLQETGDAVGYAPAFRCLVAGRKPEDSVKWGK